MSDIKLEQSKQIDIEDIPCACKVILAIYVDAAGIAIAMSQDFEEFIKQRDHEEAAQISADIMECLRRSLNTARGVA